MDETEASSESRWGGVQSAACDVLEHAMASDRRRRVRWRVAASISVALTTSPMEVHAGDRSVHAAVSGYLAFTDNVFSAPSDADAAELDTSGPEADLYLRVKPGIVYTFLSRRFVHALTGDIEIDAYATHRDSFGLASHVAWNAVIAASEFAEIVVGAAGSVGTTNALSTRSTADATRFQLLPIGNSDVITIDAAQSLTITAGEATQVSQTAGANLAQIGTGSTGSRGVQLSAGLGIDRSFRVNAVGITASGSYVALNEDLGADSQRRDLFNVSGVARWRRDLGRSWNSAVDGGVATVLSAVPGDRVIVSPVFGGQLSYAPDWGSAAVQVRHTVAANLFLAQHTMSDSVSINALLPLPWVSVDQRNPEFRMLGTMSGERIRLIDLATDDTDARLQLIAADIALAWQPRSNLDVSLRYQYLRQTVDGMPIAEVFAYSRNTVLITFGGRWPERLAGEVPLRSSLRVDRRGMEPIGGATQTPSADDPTSP